MAPTEAAWRRDVMLRSIDSFERADMMAYGWARVGVVVAANRGAFCECQVQAWDRACAEYLQRGPRKCWEALGVTADVMKRATLDRLERVALRGELGREERARLEQLRRWGVSS